MIKNLASINLVSSEVVVTTLEKENKLIEAGFEYVRYSERDELAIYRKPK
jgi:hypothetical protein